MIEKNPQSKTTVVSCLDQWESARKILSSSFNSHNSHMPDCVSTSVMKITCLKLIKRDSSKETASLPIWHVWSSSATCNCVICCGIPVFLHIHFRVHLFFKHTYTSTKPPAKSCLSSEHDSTDLITEPSLPSRALRWKRNSLNMFVT